MSAVYFAEPQWVHLLWAVLIVIVMLAWLDRRGGNALGRFVGTSLQARLVTTSGSGRRLLRLLFLLLCGVFLTLALMRPQWGLSFVSSKRAGAEIMVALDVSRSMLAEDVAPNRLERAKAELRDLLSYLDGDQVGLIAFAGRATVLSPLTPDFGFLRLVLDEAGPNSVGRGGTRLEEPIRKAIAGFGDGGEAARALLLITDGEDHDSFPLEAAKTAAERGIRIIAIGFGDEAGSEIIVTDPRTGARAALRDSDGNAVKSRLDGELLREVALLTEGAYIPAGTGVLDLESIYRRHIATLIRANLDGRGRSVRNDAYQWAVLLAILCLLAAAASTATSAEPKHRTSWASVIILGILITPLSPTAHAQPGPASAGPATAEQVLAPEPAPPELEIPGDARSAHNQALRKMNAGALAEADQLFSAARANAGVDAETRFRATYNLGWLQVKRADAVLDSEPETALSALQSAADWFREAVALRPGHEDSRHNLEIVLRRAMALADSLAQRDERALKTRIEALIKNQRGYLDELRGSVDLPGARNDPNVTRQTRRVMREYSARQLALLGEAQALSESAAQELAALRAKAGQERSEQDQVRAAQLEYALQYLHRARERMGQARSQLRRLQAERAYRRGAGALTELKRARDQLLDPGARLESLLADSIELARLTSATANAAQALPDRDQAVLPAWLTPQYLQQTQSSLSERTGELHQHLSAGLAQSEQSGHDRAADQQQDRPAQRQWLEQLRAATPLIGAAQASFEQAGSALDNEQSSEAVPAQRAAIANLNDAREQFLDLPGLIERLYRSEQRINAIISEDHRNDPQNPPRSAEEIAEYVPLAAELQRKNRRRAARVGTMVADALVVALNAEQQAATQQPAHPPSTAGPDPAAERQRLEKADQLQLQVQHALGKAQDDLEKAARAATASVSGELEQARTSVTAAVSAIEQLRRLFFSLIDHLKESAAKQTDINDQTETISVLANAGNHTETAAKIGPLAPLQQDLARTAGELAEALSDHANSSAQADAADGSSNPQADQERYRQAAHYVSSARQAMENAVAAMSRVSAPQSEQQEAADSELASLREQQDTALSQLLEAVALLQPRSDNQDQDQNPDQNQQNQDNGSGEQEGQRQQSNANTSQLMQSIRDREAQRRRERARNQPQGFEPVAKDW